ncbi:hypothetical protein L226DRAFT_574745 [Lentinus tigrinus ALCF2SS1-7]|uniref:F-box domain-containing protein n=1 Tax=Lentinus tigrinus ALCF2SS1-6 TaxID=1328759 RepID=A0A5C2S351_9APHY|nr:hypothetical protein L227DRAFT_613314 [Lentinus tigrinus ALCF2SS1-6]RPD70419.1 hypothetical protein L226DRAFT_574745 [Lentinus tigrinus ALCF2SS1-7]
MTTSVPHALAIPEIIIEIAEHVYAEPDPRTRRRGLARLARLDRIFYHPAVRLLWGDMQNIEPLFRLLSNCGPTQASVIATEGEGELVARPSYSLTLQGPILDDDIARLREYARHIRALDFPVKEEYSWDRPSSHAQRGITLDPYSLENLLLRTGLPLLPFLEKLTLPVSPPYLSDPTFLLCPSLRELTISFPERHLFHLIDGIGQLFSGIFAHSPRLTHLRVQSECYEHHDPEDVNFRPWMRRDDAQLLLNLPQVAESPTPSQVFCDALAAVSMLDDMEVFSFITMNSGVAGRNLVTALSALPRLRECSLAVFIPPDVLRTIRPGFANLRVLVISNVVFGTELKLFNSPYLQDLTIYHCDWISSDTHRRTLELISHRFPDLRRLSWELGHKHTNASSGQHILVVIIRPLSILHGLQNLFIDAGNRDIHDDDIALLVEGSPRLAHLDLKFHIEKTGPTAHSLLTLAQGCPSLATLRLSGLFITEEDEGKVETYPYVGNHLRWLDIADLRCMGVMHGAMIIDMLFPFLDIGECRLRASTTRYPKGQLAEVLVRLAAYHAARE